MPPITAAILAGGLGTRLRPVVSDRPKVLAMVRGKPFLAYLLDQLVEAGIRRAVLLTGYRAEQVRDVFGHRYRSIRLEYSVEASPLGTAGALRLALPKLFLLPLTPEARGASTVLVMNGDSQCEVDLQKFQAFHERESTDASLVVARASDSSRFGKVEISPDHRVASFFEKHEAGGPGWINAGIYLINRNLVEEVPPDRAVSLEREMFPAWVGRKKLCGFHVGGAFLDIGTPESYVAAEEFFGRRAAS